MSDGLDGVRSFVRAAETGSFSAVARERNVGQPTISKQVAALEDRLGVQLLARTTRNVTMTEEGVRYYEAVRDALEGFEVAEAAAKGGDVSGRLRVGCAVAFGRYQIIPRLTQFFEMHPQLAVDLVVSDAFIDPVEAGVDVAIRIGELKDSALLARKIGVTRRVAVASPDYLERHGRPKEPAELADHECVLFVRSQLGTVWPFTTKGKATPVEVRGRFTADASPGVLQGVISGLGVGLLPLWLAGQAIEQGKLVRILEAHEPPSLPIHLISAPRRFTPPKVKVFADFLSAAYKDDPWVSGRGLSVVADA